MFIKSPTLVLVVDAYPTIRCERSLFSTIESNNMVMAIIRTSNDAFFLTIRLAELSNTSSLWQINVIVKPLATDIKIIGSDLTVYNICETGLAQQDRLPYAGNLTAQAITVALEAGQTKEIPHDICVHLISRPKSYHLTNEPNHSGDDLYLAERYHILADEYPSISESFNNNMARNSEIFDRDHFSLMRCKHLLLFLEPPTDNVNGEPFTLVDLSQLSMEKDEDLSAVTTAQRKATNAFNAVKRFVGSRLDEHCASLQRNDSVEQ